MHLCYVTVNLLVKVCYHDICMFCNLTTTRHVEKVVDKNYQSDREGWHGLVRFM